MQMGVVHGRLTRVIAATVLVVSVVSSLGPARAATTIGSAHAAAQVGRQPGADRAQAADGSTILYVANAATGFARWTSKDKTKLDAAGWHVEGGQLVSEGGANLHARAPFEPGTAKLANYAVDAQIRVLSLNTALPTPHSFGVRVRGAGLENNYGYLTTINADQRPSPHISSLPNGDLVSKQFVLFEPMAWHTYRTEIAGAQIRYLIDGVVVLKTSDTGWKDGGWVGLFANGARIAVRSFIVRTLSSPSQGYTPACAPHCGSGAVLYHTNWSQGTRSLLDWSAPSGDPKGWNLSGGMLVTDEGSGGLVRPDFAPGDFGVSAYAVEAQMRLQGAAAVQNPSYALRIRGQGLSSNYGFEGSLAVPKSDVVSAAIWDAGGGNWVGGKRFVVFDPTIWHTYRIAVSGKNLEYLIDGVPVAAGTSEAWKYGGFGGISFSRTTIAVRSFSILSLSGTALPAAPPCSPHCGSGGGQYALPPTSFSAHNLLDWEMVSGAYNSWQVKGGALVGTAVGSGGMIKPDYEPGVWNRADYAVQAEIQVLRLPQGGSPSYGVIARGQGIDKNYGYQASMVFNGTTWDAALYNRGGGQLARKTLAGSFALGSWHTIRIEVSGTTQARMLVDGSQVLAGSENGGWKYGGWAAVYFSGPQIAVRSFAIE